MLTVLLAVAWMPLTVHCQAEKIAHLELLSCSTVEAAGSSDGSPCDDALCCSWETSQYRLPPSQPPVPVQLLAMVSLLLVTPDSGSLAESAAADLTALSPDLPKPWPFLLRAALPVRAPSIAS
jgi:hypothetical protein